MIKAVDISKWSAVDIGPDWFRWLKEQGFELIVIGLWHGAEGNGKAEAWIARAVAAGLKVYGYTALNMRSGYEAVNQAAAAAGLGWQHVERLALDVELETTAEIIENAIDRSEIEGKKPFIYTRQGAWSYGPICPELGLWNARYDNTPSFDLAPPYGGWTKAIGHQYYNDTLLNGVQVDLNVFDPAWVEGEDMTAEQERQLRDHLSVIWGQAENVQGHTEKLLELADNLDDWNHDALADAIRNEVGHLRSEADGAKERVVAVDHLIFGVPVVIADPQ